MKNLNYGELLVLSKKVCKKYYESTKPMFGSTVTNRNDEKNVVYSAVKSALAACNAKYDVTELKAAVDVSVDEANIKKYSSYPPPKL